MHQDMDAFIERLKLAPPLAMGRQEEAPRVFRNIDPEKFKALMEDIVGNSVPRELTLRNQNLTSEELASLTKAFQKNSNVTALDLANNQVDTESARFTEMLKHNTRITSLNLRSARIHMESLSAMLATNTSLLALNLTKNSIDKNGAKYLSRALKNNAVLTTLNLAGNALNSEGLKLLCEALLKNRSLTHWDLSHNKIPPEGAKHLRSLLRTHSGLLVLNLEDNPLGLVGTCRIAQGLAKNNTLLSINLTKIYTNYRELDTGIQLIFDALHFNRSLEQLIITDPINTQTTKRCAEMMMRNDHIRFLALRISSWFVYNESLHYLMIHNRSLQSLNLNSSYLGNLNLFSKTLFMNNTLTQLDLSRTELGGQDSRLELFGQALAKHPSLTDLNLASNAPYHLPEWDDWDKKWAGLIKGLSQNQSLTALNLASNFLGSACAKFIAQWLLRNRSLITLNLNKNRITDKGALSLFYALLTNKTLTSLKLDTVYYVKPGFFVNYKYREADMTGPLTALMQHNDTLGHLEIQKPNHGEPWNPVYGDAITPFVKEKLAKNATRPQVLFLAGMEKNLNLKKCVQQTQPNERQEHAQHPKDAAQRPKYPLLSFDLFSERKELPKPKVSVEKPDLSPTDQFFQNPLFEPKIVGEIFRFLS